MTEQPRVDPTRGQAAPDPWRSFRGVMAGTLILEAIVVLLALPVVAASEGGLTALDGRLPDRAGGGAGADGRRAGPAVGDLGEPGDPGGVDRRLASARRVGFIGVIFAVVWLLIVYLRAEVSAGRSADCCRVSSRPPD